MEHIDKVVKSLLVMYDQLIEGYSDHWSSYERLFAAQLFAKSVEARFWAEQGVVFLPDGMPGFTPPDDIPDLPLIDEDEEIEVDEDDEEEED